MFLKAHLDCEGRMDCSGILETVGAVVQVRNNVDLVLGFGGMDKTHCGCILEMELIACAKG